MNKIPTNVPVFITSVEQDEQNPRFTKAKLKVFYIGETGDHRLFTKEFSDKIIETLPLTPVVAFYSADDEDFKGHNEVQYVYGVVPESPLVEYVEEEGTTYVVTDVILFTERKDNIGEVARKIIGKQHSLEMNPDTLEYKINRDGQGHVMNIEFLDGQFIGLSVLGDNEKPAFSGSGFFMLNDENFEQLTDKFAAFAELLNKNGGNIEVFNSKDYFSSLVDKFASMTMQDFQQKLYAALEAKGIYGYLVENTEDYAIFSRWCDVCNQCVYTKYGIMVDGEELKLDDGVDVKARYLTEEEIAKLDNEQDQFACGDDEKKPKDEMEDSGDSDESQKPADEAQPKDDEDDKSEQQVETNCTEQSEPEGEVNVQASEQSEQTEQLSQAEEIIQPTENNCSTTLSDSERQELENYRRENKQRLIDSYKEELTEEMLNTFNAEIDSYDYAALEAKLAIEFRKLSVSKKHDNTQTVTVFSAITPATNDYDENSAADVIRKHSNIK